MTYKLGRMLQLLGLLAMPFAMWVAHFERSEAKSISIFVGAILLFFIGYVLTQIKKS